MSASLHLARPDDLPRLLPLVAAFHDSAGIAQDDTAHADALAPLLDGSPHGAVWLIGPRNAPLGYMAISFGWSVGFGGLTAGVDEMFIRERLRGRGLARSALIALLKALRGQDVRGVRLEVSEANAPAWALCTSLGFEPHAGGRVLSAALAPA